MSTVREQFKADGFYLNPEPIFSEDIVANAVAGMDAIRRGEYDTGRSPYESPWNPGDPDDVLCKIEMPGLASQGVYDLISHANLGKLAAEITGAEMIQVWWVQLLYKPAVSQNGVAKTNVGMHQDLFYWQNHWEEDSELFTAWVALSDVTPQAGSMHFVKGSHKWGLGEDSDFFAQEIDAQKEAIKAEHGQEWIEVPSALKPGGVSFHDCVTYHGSGPNFSGAPRRSFAIHLRTEKSRIKNGRRDGLTEFIEDLSANPVIYGDFSLKG